ncbi:hypothetical protein CHU92_09515 [Flavobacterium cyanobacteriorum]|uniref:Protein BatD n=1 Tax=Flavobacterium cyanobacteriorum TaxID=2022802 RepID=A0A255Z5E9_9FLAO|nr:hypothetical protein CHU92_09515 [Flavobacterium cyanobacteriorum]
MKKLFTILLVLLATPLWAQQKPLQAAIDSARIKIGSQANLTIKATVDTAATVRFPEGRNFGRLEVLESYPVDTVKKGAIYELVKKYGLTQFDSGRYIIPRLPVVINNKMVYTDSLRLEVKDVKVDTVKQQMFDIKPVIAAPSAFGWLWYIVALLALAALGAGIWWYVKKRKAQPKKEKEVFATPIEKATAKLKNLEKKELLQRGAIKDYYSELTDIARIYIEEAIHIPAMESTTSELIDAMRGAVQRRKMRLSQETFEQLERVLRTADMVKFAKSRPMDFEIAEDRDGIEKAIVVIDKSIPQETEDEEALANEILMAQRLKKKRRKRVIIGVSVSAFILLLAGIFFTGRYIRDNVLGRPLKDLLDKEWVTSEYGVPPVKIETPEVLKRFKDEKVLNNLPPNVSSYQKFSYEGFVNNLHIVVVTNTFKEPVQIDPEKAVNGELAAFEKNFKARNIVTKMEEFTSDKGFKGMRASGTMTITIPLTGKEAKVFYNILLFTQPTAAQEVIIFHEEGDTDAEKITERILNSVELAKAVQ